MYDLNIPGYMTEQELQIIEEWASQVPVNGVIVELGSLMGRSSYCWATSCHNSVTVYCIDKFPETFIYKIKEKVWEEKRIYDEFLKNTKDLKNVIHIRGTSPKEIVFPKVKIDVFFIDASHENPDDLINFNFYKRYFNKNVLICGDDYEWAAVSANAKYIADLYKTEVKLYENTSLWSIQT